MRLVVFMGLSIGFGLGERQLYHGSKKTIALAFLDMGGLIVGQWALGLCVRREIKKKNERKKMARIIKK